MTMKWIGGVLIGVGGTLGRRVLLTMRWLRGGLHNAAPEATTQPPGAHDIHFRSVWETAMDAMVVTDAAGIIQSANPAYYRLYGYEPPEMIGKHFTMVVPQEQREQVWASYQQVFTGPDEVEPVETVVRRADGSERMVEARFGFLTEQGQRTALLTVLRDLTAWKDTEAALREQQYRLRLFFESSLDGIMLTDNRGRYLDVNPAACTILGYSQDALLTMSSSDVIILANGTSPRDQFADYLRTGVGQGEFTFRRADGAIRTAEYSARRLNDDLHMAILRDVTERKQAAAAIREQVRLAAVQEERTRLARELHDSVSQALYSLNLYTDAMRMTLAASAETDEAASHAPPEPHADLHTYVHELQQITREALLDMRLLVFALRSPLLQQEGLVGAIRARLESVERRSGITADLQVSGEWALPTTLETDLYRVLQEALNNVAKHARARTVTITMQCTAQHVRVAVCDDGIGFDLAHAQQGGGMGLRGIAERLESLGGTLDISSAPGSGTCLRVEIAGWNEPEGAPHADA